MRLAIAVVVAVCVSAVASTSMLARTPAARGGRSPAPIDKDPCERLSSLAVPAATIIQIVPAR